MHYSKMTKRAQEKEVLENKSYLNLLAFIGRGGDMQFTYKHFFFFKLVSTDLLFFLE